MPTKKTASKKATSKKAASKQAASKKVASKKVVSKQSATPKVVTKKAPQSAPYEQGAWAHVYTREPGERRYWLVKSEPEVFSFDDLMAAPKQTTCWDSVRNTGARNFLRDAMKLGDLVFYYHSNAEPSAIVGICEVVREGYPDSTAFDPSHPYYDADSNPATPTWFMVDIKGIKALDKGVTLPEIKADPSLAEIALIRVSRLSIVPITKREWDHVVAMGTL